MAGEIKNIPSGVGGIFGGGGGGAKSSGPVKPSEQGGGPHGSASECSDPRLTPGARNLCETYESSEHESEDPKHQGKSESAANPKTLAELIKEYTQIEVSMPKKGDGGQ